MLRQLTTYTYLEKSVKPQCACLPSGLTSEAPTSHSGLGTSGTTEFQGPQLHLWA